MKFYGYVSRTDHFHESFELPKNLHLQIVHFLVSSAIRGIPLIHKTHQLFKAWVIRRLLRGFPSFNGQRRTEAGANFHYLRNQSLSCLP